MEQPASEPQQADESKTTRISRFLRRFRPGIEKRELSNSEAYVKAGLEKIKDNQFMSAIEHFSNAQIAKTFGIRIEQGRATVAVKNPSAEQVKAISLVFAANSKFNLDSGIMKISPILNFTSNPNEEPFDLDEKILHEASLVCAEEWTHFLQWEKHRTLTDVLPRVRSNDFNNSTVLEQDVAVYFFQNHIPMTENFLDRYERRVAIEQLMTLKDKLGNLKEHQEEVSQ